MVYIQVNITEENAKKLRVIKALKDLKNNTKALNYLIESYNEEV